MEEAIRQQMQPEASNSQVNREANENALTQSERARISMEDFANTQEPTWNDVAYEDTETQKRITQQVHQEMVEAGQFVKVSEETLEKVAQSYPDLQSMKKADRQPILKRAITELKNSLRTFLNGMKGSYEFEVNGNILEAKLYDTGIREVMKNVTQEKSDMLFSSKDIFQNARYLYSTPDYEGNPNIYRWNYFYTPVQIGDRTVGVRIAVRDVAKGTNLGPESQIYHWGIKENAPLDGGSRGQMVASPGASSGALSEQSIPQPVSDVKEGELRGLRLGEAFEENQNGGMTNGSENIEPADTGRGRTSADKHWLIISVAQGDGGNDVYNIGDIEKGGSSSAPFNLAGKQRKNLFAA